MNATPDAIRRLEQTRRHLSEALQDIRPPPSASPNPVKEGGFARWLSELKAQPVAGVLLNLVQAWWHKQPLRLGLKLAGAVTNEVLRPTAKAHPYRLVLAAVGVGALFAMVRPWRWLPTAALLSGVLPALLARAVKLRSSQPRRS